MNELSRLSGNVEINNNTKAEIYILNRLKDGNKINYSGDDPGQLYIRTNARFNGSTDFQNNKGEIYFEGNAADGTVVKRTGSGKGTLTLSDTTSLSGTCEFYNDSSSGINIGCLEVSDGYRIENVRKSGGINLNSSVTLVPGTRIRVEGTDENRSGLRSWDSPITVGNFLVRFSGSGTGDIDLCKDSGDTVYGGVFTARILGNHNLNINVFKDNWRDEQFVEHNLYDAKVNIEKYNYLYTTNFERLYLEGCHGLCLYGNFADNTKIIADGSDNGYIYLKGNYDGTIKFHGIVKALGQFHSENDLHDGTEITYNCPNDGTISLSRSCTVEGSVTINKLSKYNLYIFGKIGDGATINVREDYPGLLQITEDIPAGATVNY